MRLPALAKLSVLILVPVLIFASLTIEVFGIDNPESVLVGSIGIVSGYIITGAVPFVRRSFGRILFGVVYLVSALFNFLVTIPNADSLYLLFAEGAALLGPVFEFYRQMIVMFITPNAVVFTALVASYEAAVGVLMLAKGRVVKLGLVGGLLFQIGLAPALGLGGVSNLFLAASQGFLLSKEYDLKLADALRDELR